MRFASYFPLCKHDRDGADAPVKAGPASPGPDDSLLRQLEDDIFLTMRVITNAAANTQGQVTAALADIADAQAAGRALATLTNSAGETAVCLIAQGDELASGARKIARDAQAAWQLAAAAGSLFDDSAPFGGKLAEAAGHVASVVHMIEKMARQGNFLALNASLEASRNSQSGSLFAVIANESQQLAEGMRAASADLAARVSALESAAGQNREVMQKLHALAARLRETIDAMRAASEAQAQACETTQASLAEHSERAVSLSVAAAGLGGAIGLARARASQARQGGAAMTALLERLTQRSVVFLRNSSHGNRRRHERVPMKAPGEMEHGRSHLPVFTLEVARAGCVLVPAGARFPDEITPGARAMLRLEGLGSVAVTLLASTELGWHTRFDAVEDGLAERIDRLMAQGCRDSQPAMQLARAMAAEVGGLFSHGLDAAEVTIEELLTADYRPIEGTDPVQYAAPALAYYERVLPPVLEAARASPVQPLFALATDRNAYAPVHHPEFSQAQRVGEPQWNDLNARHRRLYDRWLTLVGARNRAPCSLRAYIRHQADGTPLPIQVIAAPVFVRGHFWGNVQIGRCL